MWSRRGGIRRDDGRALRCSAARRAHPADPARPREPGLLRPLSSARISDRVPPAHDGWVRTCPDSIRAPPDRPGQGRTASTPSAPVSQPCRVLSASGVAYGDTTGTAQRASGIRDHTFGDTQRAHEQTTVSHRRVRLCAASGRHGHRSCRASSAPRPAARQRAAGGRPVPVRRIGRVGHRAFPVHGVWPACIRP